MPIQFPVSAGTILLCDYGMGGFMPPEMVKRRPAVVISQRLPHRDFLCAVVPLSGSPPEHDVPYIVKLELDRELPHPFPQRVWWAKADMVATVAFKRLDLFRTVRGEAGKRQYLHPKLSAAQLEQVRHAVAKGLGLVT